MGSNFNRNNSRNEQRQEALDFARQRFSNTNGPTNNVMGPSPTPKDAQPGGPQQVQTIMCFHIKSLKRIVISNCALTSVSETDVDE